MTPKIEVIARAVILTENGLLLCRQKSGGWFFLPGGHIKFGESSEKALARELKEELGINTKVGERIGTVEHFTATKREIITRSIWYFALT